MECLHCNRILLNVNVYRPIETIENAYAIFEKKNIFESVYTKWNVGLNGYFIFVYVLVNELG